MGMRRARARATAPRSGPDSRAPEVRPPVPDGPYLVAGLGRAGRAAIDRLVDRFGPASVRAWDDSRSDAARLARRAVAATGVRVMGDPDSALAGVRTVVKSPGIWPDHPLLVEADRREVLVIDELELGWRLASEPTVAVTGTNGKSTTARLIAAALAAGGLDAIVCGNSLEGPPLCAAAGRGGRLVVETSSYQLEGCPGYLPAAAVLTNLTHDHLHRHGSMEAYAAAKRRLFVRGDRAVPLAVLNGDDPLGRRLAREVRDRGGRVVTFGRGEENAYRVRECSWSLRRATATVGTPGGDVELETGLPGPHNAANAVGALALADGLGLARAPTLAALGETGAPPGRFEPVDAGQAFDVIVDFAHTPDGIEQALATARAVVAPRDGRLIVVFAVTTPGAREAREESGRLARTGADELILCGSSLKGDPPLALLERALSGARSVDGARLEIALDRRSAIARGFERARPGDLVAILGRGPLTRLAHDRFGTPDAVDDRALARELLGAGSSGSVRPRTGGDRRDASETAVRA